MKLGIEILLVGILGIIAISDFKKRTFPLWSMLLLIIVAFVRSVNAIGVKEMAFNSSVNILLMAIQLAIVYMYFKLTRKLKTAEWKKYMGNGDILMFLVLSLLCNPVNFIYFQTISLLLVLVFYQFYRLVFGGRNELIPLAGAMAALLILASIISLLIGFNWYTTYAFSIA